MQFCHKANVYSGHVDFRLPKQIVKRLFAFGWTASRAKEKIRMATRVTSPANATRSLSSVWTNVQGKWYHAQIMTNMYAMLRSWRIRTSVGIWLWVFICRGSSVDGCEYFRYRTERISNENSINFDSDVKGMANPIEVEIDVYEVRFEASMLWF